jgi:hypothetical protein
MHTRRPTPTAESPWTWWKYALRKTIAPTKAKKTTRAAALAAPNAGRPEIGAGAG